MTQWKRGVLVLVCGLALALAACGGEEENQENGETTTGFSGGTFTVTVQSVQDNCFDGAMNSIVLPTGDPNNLPAPVTIPASTALPAQVDIEFNEPFQNASGIEFELVGDNGLRTTGDGFEQIGVDISSSEEQDCLADMMVTAELSATDDDTFTGTGTLTITSTEGEDCPAFQEGPPCTVTTPMTATRAN